MAAAPGAPAAEPPPGATSCSGCHAPAGRVSAPSIPPLAGLAAADMARALAEYRAGERPGTVMDRIARGFTAAESEAIARWLEANR
ncbi:cytochrome c [Stella sp.]|uniref:c-type cytochrome n=1 Tax=Stella sp. TaxID=2912054 RepID=UPI0035B25955